MLKSTIIGSHLFFAVFSFANSAVAEEIKYFYNQTGQRGIIDITPNSSYTIYDKVGGCGGNDVARCELDSSGKLRAYYKDSCSTGDYGPAVNGGTSSASWHQYTVECTFVKQLVKFTYDYDNRVGEKRLGVGEYYTIYDKVGGCGGRDIAQCHITSSGEVKAYYKDSCGTGTWGEAVAKGTSTASEVGYTVTCSLE